MAKSVRTSASSSRKASSLALQVSDEFCNLKEVHRAYACLGGLLSPIHRAAQDEEFSIEPGDLRALVRLINDEMERRAELVDAAICSLREALGRQGKAKAKAKANTPAAATCG